MYMSGLKSSQLAIPVRVTKLTLMSLQRSARAFGARGKRLTWREQPRIQGLAWRLSIQVPRARKDCVIARFRVLIDAVTDQSSFIA